MAEVAAHMPLRSGVATPATVRSVSSIRAMKVDYAKVASEMDEFIAVFDSELDEEMERFDKLRR